MWFPKSKFASDVISFKKIHLENAKVCVTTLFVRSTKSCNGLTYGAFHISFTVVLIDIIRPFEADTEALTLDTPVAEEGATVSRVGITVPEKVAAALEVDANVLDAKFF